MKSTVLLLVAFIACVLKQIDATGCSVWTPEGTLDLTKIPTSTQSIHQMYQGMRTLQTFSVNLCQPIDTQPGGVTKCDGPGYIQEFNDQICECYWPTVKQDATYQGDEVVVSYNAGGDAAGWSAEVHLKCGSALDLQSLADVDVTGAPTALVFAFQFSSSAACTGMLSPTMTAPEPTGNRGIEILEFTDSLGCAGDSQTLQYEIGCSQLQRPKESMLLFCTEGFLHRLFFNNTATCDTRPVAVDKFTVGQCYMDPAALRSTLVKQCRTFD